MVFSAPDSVADSVRVGKSPDSPRTAACFMNRNYADRTKRRLLAVLQGLAPNVGRKLWRRGVAKLDGWRALAYVDRGGTRLISRRGREFRSWRARACFLRVSTCAEGRHGRMILPSPFAV